MRTSREGKLRESFSIFFSTYIDHHPKKAAMMGSMPLPNSPRLMMALVGPVVGIVTGAIIGILALLVGRLVRSKEVS